MKQQAPPLSLWLVTLACVAVVASCSQADDPPTTTTAPRVTRAAASTTAAIRTATIPYLENAGAYRPTGNTILPTVEMDRYVPEGDGPWPIVLIVHGADSDSAGMADLAWGVSERGTIAYVPTYLESGWPTLDQIRSGHSNPDDALGDIACAVRTARADAIKHGGDPDRLVLVGFSRGGQIGAVVALAGDNEEVTGSASGTCLDSTGSAVPQVFVGLDGPYDWESFAKATKPDLWEATAPDLMAKISPLTYTSTPPPGAPVAFRLIASGQATDDGTFAGHAERFAALLDESGYQVSTTQLPHVWHSGFQQPGLVPEVVDLIIEATNL